MRASVIMAGLGLALVGCADERGRTATSADAWALTAASPSGPPVDCIEQAGIRGYAVRDSRTIDFSMEDGALLRNRLPFSCSGLVRNARFTYKTGLPRLCSVDQITLIRADGSTAGNCGLGAFQPVTVAPRQGALPRR